MDFMMMASTTSCDWREQTIRYNVVCRSRNNFEREVANLLTHSRIRNQQEPLLLRVTIRGPSKTPKPPLARHRRQPPASPSFPAQATQPASAGVFPFGDQTAPSMSVQSKEKAFQNEVPSGDHSKEDMSQIEPPRENFPKEETPQKDTLVLNPLKDELPQEKDLKTGKPRAPKNSTSPSPSPPSTHGQKQAAKKAEAEARIAKAQAKKRVETVMMRR